LVNGDIGGVAGVVSTIGSPDQRRLLVMSNDRRPPVVWADFNFGANYLIYVSKSG
jgi:hypothetical protein